MQFIFPGDCRHRTRIFKNKGLDIELELIFPTENCYAALRDGRIDFIGGSAHPGLGAFPQWQGIKLLCAQAQGIYWFLVMHREFGAGRGELGILASEAP
jgi:NitT/TauT family transport system substrate-binding protein